MCWSTRAVLQYADDSLIVLKGDLQGTRTLKLLLDQFAGLTGLHINYAKSTIIPIHMAEDAVQACVHELGCRREGFPQTYLGLPLSVNKLSISAYASYIQKADRYLASWQASILNIMGRVVLVNSVLDSQLVYFMSSLPLPTSVIQQMDKRRCAFMWSGQKRWENLDIKMFGGMAKCVYYKRSRWAGHQGHGDPKHYACC